MDYAEMLSKAKTEVPQIQAGAERFVVPKAQGHIQGNKTIISNFLQIAQTLRRPVEHLLKYVLKELATPGEIAGTQLILGRKISSSIINEKIEKYVQSYVICKECTRPDTNMTKEGEVLIIKCQACGAKHTIAAKI